MLVREYDNLKFAWQHFNGDELRVPEPVLFLEGTNQVGIHLGFLIMEYIDGESLADRSLPPETIDKVARAILHVQEMSQRLNWRRPGPIDGGYAEGFPWGTEDVGPAFQSSADLDHCLNRRLQRYWQTPTPRSSATSVSLCGEQLVCCHLDLFPHNVLLTTDGIVSFLDWATLAFYPAVFEMASLSRASGGTEEGIYVKELMDRLPCSSTAQHIIVMLRCVNSVSIHYAF